MARVLITGCDFVDMAHDRWCHGDLWVEGACYVFNACLSEGEVAWMYTTIGENSLFVAANDFFERRGVLVVSMARSQLSGEACDYIDKSMLGRE